MFGLFGAWNCGGIWLVFPLLVFHARGCCCCWN